MTLAESSARQRILGNPDSADQISIIVARAIAEWIQKLERACKGVDPRDPDGDRCDRLLIQLAWEITLQRLFT